MIRFFVNPEDIRGKMIMLSADDSEHIRSLRLRPNEKFIVCDGDCHDYICVLHESQSDASASEDPANAPRSYAQIIRQQKSIGEPSISCTVYLAYAKGDRLDYAISKSIELGASEIILFEAARCVVRGMAISKKMERYQKIALEAAKQSGRGIIPKVSNIGGIDDAVREASDRYDLSIMCFEDEKHLTLFTVLKHYFPSEVIYEKTRGSVKTVSVMIGPEGGFELSEAKLAQTNNISTVSLGKRLLRCETAPVAALSAIMYHTGNL